MTTPVQIAANASATSQATAIVTLGQPLNLPVVVRAYDEIRWLATATDAPMFRAEASDSLVWTVTADDQALYKATATDRPMWRVSVRHDLI